MSDFIPPQLLSTGKLPSPDDDWRYELKYDGWRAQIHVTAEGVRIFTRSGIDWTDRFPHLAGEIAASIDQPCILDGEVCALDASGRPDFTRLCGQVPAKGTLDFFAFDLIGTGSDLLTDLPLNERRTQLKAIVPRGPSAFHLVEQFDQPDDLLRFVHSNGWEGIVAKRLSSPYHSAQRTSDWLKLKCKQRQEFVIAGWRPDPQTGAIKSLVLATVDNGKLTLRGSVGTGFTLAQRRELPSRFTPSHSRSSSSGRSGFIPLKPELVAEIEYLELSGHGIVRQPTFLGLRYDKSPDAVRLEAESFSPAISTLAH